MKRKALVAILAACLLGSAQMSATAATPGAANLDANAIRTQQLEIRAAAEARKGRFKDMSDEARAELFARQSDVDRLIKDVDSLTTELHENQQIELFNALESIEAILNQAEDERMVCERHKPTGSNRPLTVCKTVAQRRVDREASQRDMGSRNLECSEATMGPGGCK